MKGDGLRDGVAEGDSEGSGEGDGVGLEDLLADRERNGAQQAERFSVPSPGCWSDAENLLPDIKNDLSNDDSFAVNRQS
jgi:hypothetical protein